MKIPIILFALALSFSALSQSNVITVMSNSTSTPGENTVFANDGGWCWFSDPRAIYYENHFKRTYAGWITSTGDIMIGYYDHNQKLIQSKIIMDNLEKDDHDNPALLMLPDGRLTVFFTKHGGSNPTWMYTMKSPEDISEWDKKELYLNDTSYYRGFTNENTYCNPIMLPEENNRIYLFWRGIDNKPHYSFSDDLGETWSKGRIFILPERIYSMQRPYVKVESNHKDKILFAFTDGHPNMEKENSIYFMYYKKGAFFTIDGKEIGKLGDTPVNPEKASLVYNARSTKAKAWIWDVAFDENENPVLVFARFPDDSNHIYTWAKWTGSEWILKDLVNSGSWFPSDPKRERNYSGGIVLDHEDPNTVYLSVKRGAHYEIEMWKAIKGGDAWKVFEITRNSSLDNVRPFAVRNSGTDNPLQLLWIQNRRYVHYTDFESAVMMNFVNR
jgi:hypothetical protein